MQTRYNEKNKHIIIAKYFMNNQYNTGDFFCWSSLSNLSTE